MKKLFFFALINLLILVGALITGMYAHVVADRYFAKDIIFIAPLLNESHLHWNTDDVDYLKWRFLNYSISAESRGSTAIASSTHETTTTVVYTCETYFTIHFMQFIEGNPWQEDTHAIVLNEALAWRLFGGLNIIGMTVDINNTAYTIVGVVRQALRGTDNYLAWKPRATSPTPLPVTALYVLAHNYNLVDSAVHTQEMLHLQFRNPANYAIIDINRYIEAIGIRSRILLYVLWLSVLILLIRIFIYMKNKQLKNLIQLTPLIFGILLALYVLFTGINDIMHWLPNMADPNAAVLGSITNVGLLPPEGYLSFGLRRLAHFNRIGNLAWIVGAVTFINLIFCIIIIKGDAE